MKVTAFRRVTPPGRILALSFIFVMAAAGIPPSAEAAPAALTASIGETMTFSLTSATTLTLPAFSTSTVSTGTTSFTVATNAGSGYAVSGVGTTLRAGTPTIPYISNGGTVAAGTSAFGVRMTTCPATCTYTTTDAGLATQLDLMTRNTTTSGDAGVVTYRVGVSNVQPSGNYTTSITYIATGLF